MALIYVLVTMIGAQSRGLFETAANGGEALAQIADHYFGSGGAIILAITVTLACLKTAVGLITRCAQTFVKMFPNGPSYRVWACGFCLLSFLIANLGLNAIVACSMPVLMFLYPLAIALILLTLCGKLFQDDPHVLRWTISLTAIAAALDFLRALPAPLLQTLHLDQLTATLSDLIPLDPLCPGRLPHRHAHPRHAPGTHFSLKDHFAMYSFPQCGKISIVLIERRMLQHAKSAVLDKSAPL